MPTSPLRCAYCKRVLPNRATAPADDPLFPFCSTRCKLADLSKWLRGEYPIAERLVDLTAEQCEDLRDAAPSLNKAPDATSEITTTSDGAKE